MYFFRAFITLVERYAFMKKEPPSTAKQYLRGHTHRHRGHGAVRRLQSTSEGRARGSAHP